ncbi:uncharacterized protein LOC9643252 isoform X1 [Selaginella moellendorffii]|uniref:uncharacterized protein LOC9643252 isoform X1 n=1 Tax=Selaginella moellendorffii TaxID=88036 RepID=UPI000D1D072C|nr:uncharacterized protein LOC9643252 isoform X1 [Selaginella moellendorffii]|eukprot:XP_024545078.1 uncharacterized protein LOC9643252 isoform X1 [Selaginella moellendorffii]
MGSATALSKVLICVHCTRIFSDNPWRNQWTNPHSNGIGLKIPLSLGILMYTLAAFLIDAITTGLLLKTSSGLITRSMAILQVASEEEKLSSCKNHPLDPAENHGALCNTGVLDGNRLWKF